MHMYTLWSDERVSVLPQRNVLDLIMTAAKPRRTVNILDWLVLYTKL